MHVHPEPLYLTPGLDFSQIKFPILPQVENLELHISHAYSDGRDLGVYQFLAKQTHAVNL